MNSGRSPHEDPLFFFSRAHTWFHSRWLERTYHFAGFGARVSIHYYCDIPRWSAPDIQLGDGVYLAPDVWLNIAPGSTGPNAKIILGKGCRIGRRSTISAKNLVVLEDDVLLAPSVLLMDHNHEFSDIHRPIHEQGVTEGGKITVEKNCWLGCSSVVLCTKGELRIGRNSVIGANSVVTRSVPPFSVIAGNPAKLVKRYDPNRQRWVNANE